MNIPRQKFATLKNVGDRLAAQTFDEELFAYQALLINVLTEPHVDHKDWTKGWAWLTPFGDYTGGLLCIPRLKRKIQFQPGSILGIRGHRFHSLAHETSCMPVLPVGASASR
jgi:hypothetical protein